MVAELLLRPDLGREEVVSVASFETDASVTKDDLVGSTVLARQIETWERQMRKYRNWEPIDSNVELFDCGHPLSPDVLGGFTGETEFFKDGSGWAGTPVPDLSKRKWQLRRRFHGPRYTIEYDDSLPQTFDDDGHGDEWETKVANRE